MTGGNILSIGEEQYGIIPRSVQTVFNTLAVRSIYLSVGEDRRDDVFRIKMIDK